MAQRVIVDVFPLRAYNGTDQQEQRAARLVKVGDDAGGHLQLVRRRNKDLCAADHG